MAWTDPRTWVAGEVVTAALGNTHWRDNFRYLYTDISGSYARVYNSADLPITTTLATVITFNSERTDTASYHSASSSDFHKLTVPSTGTYSLGTCIAFATNAVGYRGVSIRLNGTTVVGSDFKNAVTGVPTILNVKTEYTITAVGYFDVAVIQTSTSDLNVSAALQYSPEFWISRIA